MKYKVNKQILYKLYIKQGKSGLQVSRELDIPITTLRRYLKKFGIREKSISEVMTGRKLSPEHRAKILKNYLIFGQRAKGKNNPNWKGGRVTIHSDGKKKKDRVKGTKGYIWIKLPEHPRAYKQGYYPEHRYVMENKIGRVLEKYEHIHHINGIKDDNRIENLELVNAQTHNLITKMEIKIKELEEENRQLKEKLKVV